MFILTLLAGVVFGLVYEKYLSEYVNDKLSSILSTKEAELVGYQGTAKIEAVRAYLFYDHTGSISGDVLAKKVN